MSQFIIGIDLGTTNSALAYAQESGVTLFPLPQLANPGEVAEFDLLPSSLYLPGEKEFVEGSLKLPWNGQSSFIVGRFARSRGIENAGRLVGSAKSWLSHQAADPTQPLLPLNAPEGVPRCRRSKLRVSIYCICAPLGIIPILMPNWRISRF